MNKFGYNDSDQKVEVEIYGLVMEMNKISEEDIRRMQSLEEDVESLDSFIKLLLGENAIDRINRKRRADGYDDMDIMTKTKLITFAIETYVKEVVENVEGVTNKLTGMTKQYNNRAERRYEYKNRYRKGYRRY